MSEAYISVESPLTAPSLMSTTGPVRERVLYAVTQAVGGQYGVPTPEDERELPITIVQDGEDVATANYGATQITMPVALGRVELLTGTSRADARAQANRMLADLVAAMYSDETFGGLADGVDYTGGSINVELGNLVFAEAQLQVRFHHVRGDPYTIDE